MFHEVTFLVSYWKKHIASNYSMQCVTRATLAKDKECVAFDAWCLWDLMIFSINRKTRSIGRCLNFYIAYYFSNFEFCILLSGFQFVFVH